MRASRETIASASGIAPKTAAAIHPATGRVPDERDGAGGIQREKLGIVDRLSVKTA
jgi:hypothetical protein